MGTLLDDADSQELGIFEDVSPSKRPSRFEVGALLLDSSNEVSGIKALFLGLLR